MKLSPIAQTFVLHFGEMGSRWGINRTVGQMYAVLYLSDKPLNAEDLCEILGFSRSNVSMGLKELDSWNLIRKQHILEDRRDHFTTPDDIWEIVRNLIEQRRQREIEPTLTMLRDALMQEPSCKQDEHALEKIEEMHDLIDMLTEWYEDMQKMETERLVHLLKMGAKVYKLYEMKDKLKVVKGGKK